MKEETLISRTEPRQEEAGQSIVLIALALVGLLAFVGIAVDVGFVFARQTQLQAAVDSAALAGVVELVGDTGNDAGANLKAEQFFNTNGFDIQVRDVLGQALGYGRSLGVSDLGAIQYELTATWPVDLFFLRLIGQEAVTLTRGAVAGVFPMADIYASRRIEDGVLSTSNQAVFGLNSCTNMGDPFSPDGSPWAPGAYSYNYRILIPPDYDSQHDIVRVELYDPDSYNQPGSTFVVQHTQTAQNPGGMPLFQTLTCPNTSQVQPCLINTGENALGYPLDSINPFWFVRIDENRTPRTSVNGGCGAPGSYTSSFNTRTTYELFYWAQNPDGTVARITLATYTGQVNDGVRDNGNHQTDMHWVSPGAPLSTGQPAPVPTNCGSPNGGDFHATNCPGGTPIGPGRGFEVSISQDLPNIMVDPATGNRFIYMDVTAIDGSSENGFEVWAGPNVYVNSVPSDANLRNLYILNQPPGGHASKGVTVFGMGRLPLNSNIDFRVEIPLIWVGPEQAGKPIYVSMFDSDSGAAPPVHFYFDSIFFDPANPASSDYVVTYAGTEGGRCRVGDCNNQWVNPAYEIVVPGDTENCDFSAPTASCIPFYGGRLMASYDGGNTDTYGWEVRLTGAPYLVR